MQGLIIYYVLLRFLVKHFLGFASSSLRSKAKYVSSPIVQLSATLTKTENRQKTTVHLIDPASLTLEGLTC